MELIEITKDNLETEHICCAISGTAAIKQAAADKKNWMKAAFDDGYRFIRLDAKAKVLIETIPAENAWCPLSADHWLFIDCFWVSGQYKGKGYAARLFNEALKRAKEENRLGLVALSSDKKRPFLSEPGFFKHMGFVVADEAPPHYRLMALPFSKDTPLPLFKKDILSLNVDKAGLYIVYSAHCPYTTQYLQLLRETAAGLKVPFTAMPLTSKAEAQRAANPFTSWAMYYNGRFVTNEIFSPAKLEKFIKGQP